MMTTKRIPRASRETITEEKLVLPDTGGVVNVRRNLGPLSLTQMMKNSKEGELRGLLVGDDVLYWDAFQATHHQIAQALGREYQADDRVFIWRHGDNAVLVDLSEPTIPPRGALTKLNTANFYFPTPEGAFMSGDQIAMAA